MKGKIVWLACSLLVVLALLVASCAPKEVAPPAAPVEKAPPAVKEVAPAVAEKPAAAVAEAPKYGGMLRVVLRVPVPQYDVAVGNVGQWAYCQLVAESGFTQDWAKGPSGTNEIDYEPVCGLHPDRIAPSLFLGWEFPDPETIIIPIRQGVRYQNKPPVNGREVVAQDIVTCILRAYWTPGYFLAGAFETAKKPQQTTRALDKYTIEVKIVPGNAGEVMRVISDYPLTSPREIFEKYGETKDWRMLIGAGPFQIKEHTEGSATIFERFPNYWGTDPYGPGKGNQLPYIDGLTYFCIPDKATQLAALRTGKIDQLMWLTQEELKGLLRDAPQLKTKKWLTAGIANGISMRTDTPPFNDIRVRRALSMAVDRETIGKGLYGTDYNTFIGIVAPIGLHKTMTYMPLAELPPSAREVYEYHPDKAKQLLVEAGYPTGFKFEVMAWAEEQIDMLSIVKAYFAKIGVELTIDVRESSVYASMTSTHKNTGSVCHALIGGINPFRFHPYRSPAAAFAPSNYSMVFDAKLNAAYLDCQTPIGQERWEIESAKIKALLPYIVEQAYYIELPSPYEYYAWWPWLKNYSGEKGIYQDGMGQPNTWARYSWLDQALKKSMGK